MAVFLTPKISEGIKMKNLSKTILMPFIVLLIVALTITIIAITAPPTTSTSINVDKIQPTEESTNSSNIDTLSVNTSIYPIDTSFYAGLITGSAVTLIITSIFFMIKDHFEERKRLIEIEIITEERDRMRSQLSKRMTFLSNKFKQTAEAVTESRIVSDMLLLRKNND